MAIEVTECVVHGPHTDFDCEHCTKEVAQHKKVAESKFQGNNARAKRLASMGVQADPLQIIDMRVNLLVSVIIGDERTKNRWKFENNFQTALGNLMEQVEKQANMANLTKGIQPPHAGSFIIPPKRG